jgi:hypothetical protein
MKGLDFPSNAQNLNAGQFSVLRFNGETSPLKAYGRKFCPVGDQQWQLMIDDVPTMDPKILRSRRAFADYLVRLLLAFEIFQAEYVRRNKAFIHRGLQ